MGIESTVLRQTDKHKINSIISIIKRLMINGNLQTIDMFIFICKYIYICVFVHIKYNEKGTVFSISLEIKL